MKFRRSSPPACNCDSRANCLKPRRVRRHRPGTIMTWARNHLRLATMPIGREDPRPQPPPLTLDGVYREHFDFVFRMAARLGGPMLDAEDASQEVFLIVARKLDTFDGTSLVTTWLYGITLNVVRSLRRRQRLRRLFERDDAPYADVPIQSVDRAE